MGISAVTLAASLYVPVRAQAAQDVLGFTAYPFLRLPRGGPPTNCWLQIASDLTVAWSAKVNADVPDDVGRSLGPAAEYLSVQPPSGQIPKNGSYYVPIQIVAASSSQLKGLYHGTITFTATGSFDPTRRNPSINWPVEVDYVARNQVTLNTAGSGTTAAYFSRVGIGTTATQQVKLNNLGPDHLYHWRVAVINGGSWLSVSPTAGEELPNSLDAGPDGTGTNLTLTANTTGLAPGDYQCGLVITADNLQNGSTTNLVRLDVSQSYVFLRQSVAARGMVEHINIGGGGFTSASVPSFLKNGSPDTSLVLNNVTVKPDQIEADLSIDAKADLGPRTLKVGISGVNVYQTNALDVIGIRPELSQGTTNSLGKLVVANHPTVLRAFVQSGSGRTFQSVNGLLYVFSGEQQMAGSPFAPNAPSPHADITGRLLCIDHPTVKDSYSNEERFYLRDSLNFYFGKDLPGGRQIPVGNWDFFLAFSVTNLSQTPPSLGSLTKTELLARKDFIHFQVPKTQTFRTTKPLRVLALVDYRLPPKLMNRVKAGLRTTEAYLAAVYPLDGTKVRVFPANFSQSVFDIDALRQPDDEGKSSEWFARVWAKLTSVLAEHNRLFSSDYQRDRVVLVSTAQNVGQIAEDPGTGGITCLQTGAIITSDSMTTFAHELGHVYGLGDTYVPPTYTNLINPIRVDARSDGNLVEDGAVRLFPTYQIARMRPLVGVTACVAAPGGPPVIWGVGTSYQRVSQMGASDDENIRWFDGTEWTYLLGVSFGGAATPNTPPPDGDFVTIGGVLDVADNLAEVEVVRDPNGANWLPTEFGGYWMDQLDATGAVRSSESFGVSFYGPARGFMTETAFRVSAPLAVGCTKVQLRHGTNVLFSRAVSAHAPTVTVLSPAGGETVNAPFDLRWSANDTDGEALTFSVYYLRDGVEPTVVARNVATNGFHWDPSTVPGSAQGRIAVVASDGFNEGMGTSAAFTVAKKGPVVSFLSPSDGIAVSTSDRVVFVGSGYDLEDGCLPDSAFTFSSNLDGPLYPLHSSQVETNLSFGVHTITLTGVDSDGNTNQASITVTVGDPGVVPALDFLTPTSGAPGTAVTITGRNLLAANTLVLFGTNAAPITSLTATQCVVQVPAGLSPGELNVSVVIGSFRTETTSFTVLAVGGAIGSADLAISQTSQATATGLTFTITVANRGPSDATGLKITDSLPPGSTVLGATATIGACSVTNGLLTCAINKLTHGASAVVTLQLAIATSGLYTNVADVRGVEPDPVTTNNLAREVALFGAALPVLHLDLIGNSAVISWPVTTPANVVLQTSPSLSPASWVDVPGTPTNVSGRFQLTQTIGNQSRYYRLLSP